MSEADALIVSNTAVPMQLRRRATSCCMSFLQYSVLLRRTNEFRQDGTSGAEDRERIPVVGIANPLHMRNDFQKRTKPTKRFRSLSIGSTLKEFLPCQADRNPTLLSVEGALSQ